MVVGQKIALGRAHKHRTVTIDVTDTDLTIYRESSAHTITLTTGLPSGESSPTDPARSNIWVRQRCSETTPSSTRGPPADVSTPSTGREVAADSIRR